MKLISVKTTTQHALGTTLRHGLLAACLLTGAMAQAQADSRSAGFSAGVSAHGRTTEADIGLPAYPGAVPLREAGNSSAGASLGLWGGSMGVQLHVLKLRSSDPVDSVAGFYRAAMARHGEVLDCPAKSPDDRRAAPPPKGKGEGKSDKLLQCDGDHAKTGGRLLKAGTPARWRLVAMEPLDGGTQIQLVRLDLRGE